MSRNSSPANATCPAVASIAVPNTRRSFPTAPEFRTLPAKRGLCRGDPSDSSNPPATSNPPAKNLQHPFPRRSLFPQVFHRTQPVLGDARIEPGQTVQMVIHDRETAHSAKCNGNPERLPKRPTVCARQSSSNPPRHTPNAPTLPNPTQIVKQLRLSVSLSVSLLRRKDRHALLERHRFQSQQHLPLGQLHHLHPSPPLGPLKQHHVTCSNVGPNWKCHRPTILLSLSKMWRYRTGEQNRGVLRG